MSRLFSYNPCANVQFSGFLIPLHLLANIYPNIPAASAQQHAKPPKRSVLPGLRRDLMWLRTWVMGRVLAALAMGQLQQHSGFLSVGSAFFGFMRSQIESKRYFKPIGSMYGIYANIWGILMVNVTIYSTHGSYGKCCNLESSTLFNFPTSSESLSHSVDFSSKGISHAVAFSNLARLALSSFNLVVEFFQSGLEESGSEQQRRKCAQWPNDTPGEQGLLLPLPIWCWPLLIRCWLLPIWCVPLSTWNGPLST